MTLLHAEWQCFDYYKHYIPINIKWIYISVIACYTNQYEYTTYSYKISCRVLHISGYSNKPFRQVENKKQAIGVLYCLLSIYIHVYITGILLDLMEKNTYFLFSKEVIENRDGSQII